MPSTEPDRDHAYMLQTTTVALCEHDREPDNCPICAAEAEAEAEEASRDPLARAGAVRIQRPDEVVEQTGVPLN